MPIIKYLIFFIISSSILTGCVSTNEWLKTKPLDYQKGYKDGCENGEDMASYSYIFKKDDTIIYKTNKVYRSGWDEGYADCFSDKEFENMTRQGGRF